VGPFTLFFYSLFVIIFFGIIFSQILWMQFFLALLNFHFLVTVCFIDIVVRIGWSALTEVQLVDCLFEGILLNCCLVVSSHLTESWFVLVDRA
jgi:hypothetical protein